jgi:ABC-2 type transport system ATP-binding protein
MTSSPVAVVGVTKRFGAVTAVDDLSFSVEAGQVCGLLGPNGAGKTTTLRMLVGLERPTVGRTELFGTPVDFGCPQLLRVGALVEQAAFVPHLSGTRNLQLWWEAGGRPFSEADVETALAIAGLGDAVERKVRTYSAGMKQRLGFARLLLARPELLILDEPTNGLDPGEIREIRELLRRLAESGATVLVSSHHLSEVEQTCTHAVVMHHGRLVRAGLVSEIVGVNRGVYLEVDDTARALGLLSTLAAVRDAELRGDGIALQLEHGTRSDLVAALVGAGVRVETVTAQQGLEEAFLDLIEAEDR